MTRCYKKHTKYQPTDDEFVCPRCGATPEDVKPFALQMAADDECDCDMLHMDDVLFCDNCGFSTSGRAFARRIQKEKDLVTCPFCKGKGLVSLGKKK